MSDDIRVSHRMNDTRNAEYVARHCARIAGFCRDENELHALILADMIVSASRVSMCIVDFDLSVRASRLLVAVVEASLIATIHKGQVSP